MTDAPPVTVAIPTIGRVEMLPTVLTAIAFQTYKNIAEVILLDEAATPVMESYGVNQAIDLLSLKGIRTVIHRNRRKAGIGAARYRLAEEAQNDFILMVDDDVVLEPDCLDHLINGFIERGEETKWAVPTCLLINAAFEMDGYTDKEVSVEDHEVRKWIEKYPWFIPYFKYKETFAMALEAAGTQAILVKKGLVLGKCERLKELGPLPREDTYMTRVMGEGVFFSDATCWHFEHRDQVGRGNWGTSMFYRLHEAIISNPEAFPDFVGKAK